MKIKPKIGILNVFKRKIKTGVYLLFALTIVGCSDDDNESNSSIPVDIIIVVDNSGDMSNEIQGLQDNLNSGFAQILEAANLDYRIILISKYGMINDESVCIEAPLSGIADCTNPPSNPVNSTQFFHYSEEVSSTNSFCKILETLNAPDEHNLASNGWIGWLRSNSTKFFIEFSSDGVDCFSGVSFDDLNTSAGGAAVAEQFNIALTNLSPLHFGTQTDPNYRFYSLIGITDKDLNNPEVPYTSSDPITISECLTAASPGTGYQGICILTNGVRFSLCQPNNYDSIFNVMAQEVINVSSN